MTPGPPRFVLDDVYELTTPDASRGLASLVWERPLVGLTSKHAQWRAGASRVFIGRRA